MDRTLAHDMVRELMAEHLGDREDVRFRWGKGTSQLAMVQTRYGWVNGERKPVKTLVLHAPYALSADEAAVRNTILHEIAHILSPPTRDPWTGKRDIHGHAWKQTHIRIGGDGKRCGENPAHAGSQIAASTVAEAAKVQSLRVGDMVRIRLPNSKWDGHTGRIVTVTNIKFHVETAGGKLMVPKGVVRPA